MGTGLLIYAYINTSHFSEILHDEGGEHLLKLHISSQKQKSYLSAQFKMQGCCVDVCQKLQYTRQWQTFSFPFFSSYNCQYQQVVNTRNRDRRVIMLLTSAILNYITARLTIELLSSTHLNCNCNTHQLHTLLTLLPCPNNIACLFGYYWGWCFSFILFVIIF